MIIFTYHTQDEYAAALRTIQQLGVDHEAQPDDLTIITDELTEVERARMTNAYKRVINATDDAYEVDVAHLSSARDMTTR